MNNLSIRDVIDIITDVTWNDDGRHCGKIDEARNLAILALLNLEEKQEREQGCEYCNKDVMSGNPIITKHSDGYVGNCNFSGYIVAKFCPMCGRRLRNE